MKCSCLSGLSFTSPVPTTALSFSPHTPSILPERLQSTRMSILVNVDYKDLLMDLAETARAAETFLA